MRAARYHDYGPASILVVEEVPKPHAGPGEIRIKSAASSVNPIDWKIRSGATRDFFRADLPAIPGRDAAGVVDEIGADVPPQSATLGDRVFGLGGIFGASAEHVVLSAWATLPETWTLEQGAAAGLAVASSAGALNALGVTAGRTLLIEGAAGGVGSAAVAIAIARGATVIGTASVGKHDFLRSLGALATTYGEGLTERVEELAPQGVDLVLDTAGSGSLPNLLVIAGEPDRLVTVADFDRSDGLGVRLLLAENDSALLAEAAALGASGQYRPHIAETFPLERIAEAHRLAERGRTQGKIVVTT